MAFIPAPKRWLHSECDKVGLLTLLGSLQADKTSPLVKPVRGKNGGHFEVPSRLKDPLGVFHDGP